MGSVLLDVSGANVAEQFKLQNGGMHEKGARRLISLWSRLLPAPETINIVKTDHEDWCDETAKARVIVECKNLIGSAASQVEQDVVFTFAVFHCVARWHKSGF